MKTQLNHMRRLKEDAAMVVNDICDQDTGWFYALQGPGSCAEVPNRSACQTLLDDGTSADHRL